MRPFDPRLLPHLAPARTALLGGVAAGTISGALLVAQAFAVAGLVTALLAQAWDGARSAGVLLAAVTVGRALASWLVDVLAARASAAVTTRLRERLLTAALALGPFALSRRRSGEVALLATRGVAAVDPYLTRYLPALVLAAVLPPLTVVAIATQDLLSAGIVVATLPLVPVFAVLVGMATRDRAESQWRALAQLSGHFVDVMRGLPTLVAYRRATAQSRTIRAVTERYRRATTETLRLAFASSVVLELVATLSVALVAVTVGLRLSGGSLDLRTALVVLLLAPEAYWPLRRVGAEFHAAAEGTATFEAADELLREAGAASTVAAPAPQLPGEIGLEGLVVRYPGRAGATLEGLRGRVPARGVTAVVGPSGSGKSTLLAALMGHLPLEEGAFTLDGQRLAPESRSWREQVAWVPQRPWITAGTVAENVRLGRPAATDSAVWAALRRVDLDDLVASLPGGLDEPLGEDGAGLSAGERARLALARAVVSERPVVLLDEPTAHLDPLTESVIADTVEWLGRRATVVVVAHRPALVALADHVIEVPLLAPADASDDAAAAMLPADPSAAPTPVVARGREAPPPEPEADTPASPLAPARRRDTPRVRLAVAALLGALAAASGVALTATAGWLIAKAAEHPPVLTLMVAIVGVRTFGLARPALRYVERLLSHDAALRLLAERRAAVYDVLVPLVPGRLGRQGGPQRGDVLASIVDDVDSLLDRHLRVRAPLLTCALVAALATGFAAWVLPAAGAVTGVTLLLGAASAYGISRWGVGRAEERYVAGRAAVSGAVVRLLHGAADLVMWQADRAAVDDVTTAGTEATAAATRSSGAIATARALAVAVSGVGVLLMAGVGGAALADGRVSGPMLALLLLLPLALTEVTVPLADAGAVRVRVAAADRRLAGLTSLEPVVTDPEHPVPAGPQPDVELHDVAAGWGESPALQGLDLHLAPGSRVAVVGPSGSGKSTLAALLLRFLDPSAGRVDLAGVPMPSLRLDEVRGRVGLVDDDPHVFASTVLENVRLARPGASAEQVEAALRAVRLGPWVDQLPNGLDTMLGDGYTLVSGGERARLGMARAVLADLPVLVLDEPTAHLDAATAESVAADLLDSSSGRSVVWITHGTAGLDRVDRVLALGEGRPAEQSGPTPVLATPVA